MKNKAVQMIMKIFSFLLFPVTFLIFTAPIFVFFLPFVNHELLILALRILILLWIIIFITSLILLSSYCGYLCPVTRLFNFVAAITKDKSILTHRFPKVVGKITLLLWSLSIFYVLLRLAGNIFGFLPREEVYNRIEVVAFYLLYGIASIFLKTKAGSDDLGHYLCPISTYIKIGIWLNKILNIHGFRIVVHSQNCKHCGLCNNVCSYQNDVQSMVMDGKINYKVCSNCGKCIAVCKQNTIQRKWSKFNNTRENVRCSQFN